MTQMDAADRHVPCGDSCEAVQWATGRAKYQDLSQMVSSAGSRKDRWLRPLGITRSALQTHSCAKIGLGACGSGSTPPTFGGAERKNPKVKLARPLTPRPHRDLADLCWKLLRCDSLAPH